MAVQFDEPLRDTEAALDLRHLVALRVGHLVQLVLEEHLVEVDGLRVHLRLVRDLRERLQLHQALGLGVVVLLHRVRDGEVDLVEAVDHAADVAHRPHRRVVDGEELAAERHPRLRAETARQQLRDDDAALRVLVVVDAELDVGRHTRGGEHLALRRLHQRRLLLPAVRLQKLGEGKEDELHVVGRHLNRVVKHVNQLSTLRDVELVDDGGRGEGEQVAHHLAAALRNHAHAAQRGVRGRLE
ncbi:hypothetical protein STCU_10688 [Strigomonas culicis]|uniref:Uncharacterized protein n=1 Tax=Strigomonas culicis TaxID=28005 RepID=S9URT0_9TRYP|nr:hypothetical protein STCU_10688 [Strigomonas culicis]|eukprot:EPY17316.1 hypothetical protein STCU_10688 [Strigomonas culicis]